MAVEIYMPKMSDHMEYGEVIDWLVTEGERVEVGQAILELQTDKAIAELEAPAAGILKGVRPGVVAGSRVPVGETIAYIAADKESVPELAPLSDAAGAPQQASAAVTTSAPTPEPSVAGKVRATPVARRLAKQLGVDLGPVQGTGPGGRIREVDVRLAAQATDVAPAAGSDDSWLELTPFQRVTGEQMVYSVQNVPQFVLQRDVDMTNLLWLRKALFEKIENQTGERLSVTVLLVKIVALALKVFPRANASFEDGRIRLHSHVNIGVAVGTPDGLIVPVLKDADGCSLADLVCRLKAVRGKAEAKRFRPDELAGGTFTISNLGMYGIDRFSALINPPESGILAVGRIVDRPVGRPDGSVALCPVMTLSLTLDHRTLDGAQGAEFLARIAELMEKPWDLV